MGAMTVTLSPDLEAEIQAEVAAGRIKDPQALVDGAVRAQLRKLQALRQSLAEASAACRNGEGIEPDALWRELLDDDPGRQ